MPSETRVMLERYVAAMFAMAECAEMSGDTETWEWAQDSETDGRKALAMVDSGQWYSGDASRR